MSRGARAVALLTHSFSSLYLFWPKSSAAPWGGHAANRSSQKPSRKQYNKFKLTFERKCPDVSRTRGETLVRGLENAQTKNA